MAEGNSGLDQDAVISTGGAVQRAEWIKPEVRVEKLRITRSGDSYFNDSAGKPEPYGGT